MIISPVITGKVARDSSGNIFTPTFSIAYVDAFHAFLSGDAIKHSTPYRIRQLYYSNYEKLILWFNENLTGKYYCPPLSVTGKNPPPFSLVGKLETIYFESEEDAVLFKMMFS